MRDHDDGFVREQTGKRLLHHGLVLDVQARRGLVQKDNGSILEQRTSNGDALALAAGELGTVLADHGVVALRHTAHELIAVGGMCGGQDLLVSGVAAAKADVAHHRVVEEQHVLKDDRVIAQKDLRVDARHVHAAHGDLARGGVPKAGRQTSHGGLARTGRPDECRDLALLRGEAHVVKHPLADAPGIARAVAERHVVEHHVMAHGLERLAALGHGLLHDGAHALGR